MRTFLYGFTPEQIDAINGLLKKLKHAPAAVIRNEHADAELQAILEGRAAEAKPLGVSHHLVLFHEFMDRDINRFINAYPECELPQPIWAAVTDVNRHWTFRRLMEALGEEQRRFSETAAAPDDPNA